MDAVERRKEEEEEKCIDIYKRRDWTESNGYFNCAQECTEMKSHLEWAVTAKCRQFLIEKGGPAEPARVVEPSGVLMP